jgi:hypothetical protein
MRREIIQTTKAKPVNSDLASVAKIIDANYLLIGEPLLSIAFSGNFS